MHKGMHKGMHEGMHKGAYMHEGCMVKGAGIYRHACVGCRCLQGACVKSCRATTEKKLAKL